MSLFLLGDRREGGGGGRGGGRPVVSVPDGGRVCPADLQEAGVLQVGKSLNETKQKKWNAGHFLLTCFT